MFIGPFISSSEFVGKSLSDGKGAKENPDGTVTAFIRLTELKLSRMCGSSMNLHFLGNLTLLQ